MRYLLLICSDGVATADKGATMRRELPAWVDEMASRKVRLAGHQLDAPSTAKTVRVRNDETLVSDGPFVETKEFVAGFDIIDCADLDEAIAIAAAHPVAAFHMVEVRPFAHDPSSAPRACISEQDAAGVTAALARPVPDGATRHLLIMCHDGVPGTDAQEESVVRGAESWLLEMQQRGAQVYGHALQHAQTATTVRARGGDVLLTDGPFVETKEFAGGFDIVDCADVDEAVAIAAKHPLARFHMVEVRPFATEA